MSKTTAVAAGRRHRSGYRAPRIRRGSLAYFVDDQTRRADETARGVHVALREELSVDQAVELSRIWHAGQGTPFDEKAARTAATRKRRRIEIKAARKIRRLQRRARLAAFRWEVKQSPFIPSVVASRVGSATVESATRRARATGGGRPAGRKTVRASTSRSDDPGPGEPPALVGHAVEGRLA